MEAKGYQIVSEIGRGGMGVVYRAIQTSLGREVAIKMLDSRKCSAPRLVEKFKREAMLQGRLNHPNITQVYDIFEQDDQYCIVMELVRGITLSQMSDLMGAFPPALVRKICLEIGDALAAVHQAGFIHRDVKCANIMMTDNLSCKLMDFGIATFRQDLVSAEGRTTPYLGTPSYMSPEQLRGKALDHRTDIFSFGLVLYQISTGIRPIQEDSLSELVRVIEQEQLDPLEVNPSILPEIRTIVLRCLEKQPENRFQSMVEMVQLAKKLPEGEPLSIPMESFRKQLAQLEADVTRHEALRISQRATPATPWPTGPGGDSTMDQRFIAAGQPPHPPPSIGAAPSVLTMAPGQDAIKDGSGSTPTTPPAPVVDGSAAEQPVSKRRHFLWLTMLLALAIVGGAGYFAWRGGLFNRLLAPKAKVCIVYCPSEIKDWILRGIDLSRKDDEANITYQLVTEDMVKTFDQLCQGKPEGFVWIPESAHSLNFLPDRVKQRVHPGEPVCVSPLVFLMWRSRAEAIKAKCPENLVRSFGDLAARKLTWTELGLSGVAGQPMVAMFTSSRTETDYHPMAKILFCANYYSTQNVTQDQFDNPQFVAWSQDAKNYFVPVAGDFRLVMSKMASSGPSFGDGALVTENFAAEFGPSLAKMWEPVEVMYPDITLWFSYPLVLVDALGNQEPGVQEGFKVLQEVMLEPISQDSTWNWGLRPADIEGYAQTQDGDAFFAKYASLGIQRKASRRVISIDPHLFDIKK